MLNIKEVAQYLLSIDSLISQKKLQKLCYYIQAWHLAIKSCRLIDCDFEAWVHGPVSRPLYNMRYALVPQNELDDGADKQFINAIFKIYGKYSGDQLEQKTHSEEPWKEARCNLPYWEPSNNVISDKTMEEYYKSLLRGEISNA